MVLTEDSFVTIADGGMNHPGSTIAHCMAWFQGCLYMGTSAPGSRGPEDRARILRFDPRAGTWTTVFESPLVALDDQSRARAAWLGAGGGGDLRFSAGETDMMGRDIGLRAMTVFQGRSDSAPCLYVATISVFGALILRSQNGQDFAPVTEPGLGDDTVMSFRGMAVLGDRLFIAPAGTITPDGIDRNLAPQAGLFVSDDPASGVWDQAAPVGFDDPDNRTIFALAQAHGHIYAGTCNLLRGFQLWRSPATGPAPYVWTRVLTDGAGRFTHNPAAVTMQEFNGALLVGTGIPGFGQDGDNDIGPCAAELLRVHADASWDLLVGEPRFSAEGLKVPLSMMGPGFGNPYNLAILAMTPHQDALLVGTHNWDADDRVTHGTGQQIRGGYQLWSSTDGETWTCVIDDGLGNFASCGIRSLLSTPEGLFAGTLNQTKRLQVQANLRGLQNDTLNNLASGFEVLLGR